MNGLVLLGLGVAAYFLLTRQNKVNLVSGTNEVMYQGRTKSVREATASIQHVTGHGHGYGGTTKTLREAKKGAEKVLRSKPVFDKLKRRW